MSNCRHLLVALVATMLLGCCPTPAIAQQKVAKWELCTEPWKAATGSFHAENADKTVEVEGFNPTQSSVVVRRLFPCPYVAKSKEMGVWTQICNDNLYAYNTVTGITTSCYNTLVVYGNYAKNSEKESYVPARLLFDTQTMVAYGEPAHETWRPPMSIQITDIKLVNGAGKFSMPFKTVQTVNIDYTILEKTEKSTLWSAKITMVYKTMFYNYMFL